LCAQLVFLPGAEGKKNVECHLRLTRSLPLPGSDVERGVKRAQDSRLRFASLVFLVVAGKNDA